MKTSILAATGLFLTFLGSAPADAASLKFLKRYDTTALSDFTCAYGLAHIAGHVAISETYARAGRAEVVRAVLESLSPSSPREIRTMDFTSRDAETAVAAEMAAHKAKAEASVDVVPFGKAISNATACLESDRIGAAGDSVAWFEKDVGLLEGLKSYDGVIAPKGVLPKL